MAKCGSLYRGFVIWRSFSIYFTTSGVKKIVRFTDDFAIKRFVISRFHRNIIFIQMTKQVTL